MHVQAGSVIRDNDPRRNGREVVVVEIDEERRVLNGVQTAEVLYFATYIDGVGKRQRINVNRIYPLNHDKRTHGWTVVSL